MIEVKKIEETVYEVIAKLEGKEFQEIKKHVLTHFKNAKVDGFRPGKVPTSVLESTYKKEIEGELLNHVISDSYKEAVSKNDLRPISEINIEKFEVEKDSIEVTYTIPVLPEINVGDYKNLKIDIEKVEVTDERVNEELENIRKNSGKLKEAEEGVKAESGNTVNIDFEGFIDGEAFDGGKAEGYELVLGSKSFIDNFEDQIVGHLVGDEFDVNVTFPENYGASNLAGKPALFKVKLNGIKVKEESELNDELAKEKGYDSLEDMKNKTKENIVKREENRVENDFRNKIIESILEITELSVPKKLVDSEVDFQINRFGQQMQMQGLSLEQYFSMTGQNIDSMKEQMEEGARKSVKADLILGKIAELEKIEATEEEINNEIEMMAAMYGMDREKVLADLQRNGNYENFIENTAYQITRRKTVEFLSDLLKK